MHLRLLTSPNSGEVLLYKSSVSFLIADLPLFQKAGPLLLIEPQLETECNRYKKLQLSV